MNNPQFSRAVLATLAGCFTLLTPPPVRAAAVDYSRIDWRLRDITPSFASGAVLTSFKDGRLGGYYYTTDPFTPPQPVVWNGLRATDAVALPSGPNGGFVLGVSSTATGGRVAGRPARWDSTLTLLAISPGSMDGEVSGMDGPWAVGYQLIEGHFRGTLWGGYSPILLATPPGHVFSQASGVSGGLVVGYSRDVDSHSHVLTWQATTPSVYQDLHPAGYNSSRAYAVSGTEIVGIAYHANNGPFQPYVWFTGAGSQALPVPAGVSAVPVSVAGNFILAPATTGGTNYFSPKGALLWVNHAPVAMNGYVLPNTSVVGVDDQGRIAMTRHSGFSSADYRAYLLEPVCTDTPLPLAVWTGQGGNALWSNLANWQNGVVPAVGFTVDFPNASLRHDSVNDLPGLHLKQIRLCGENFILEGAGVTLTDGVIVGWRNAYNQLAFPIAWSGTPEVRVGLDSELVLSGALSGPTGTTVRKTGLGVLKYFAVSTNTFAGTNAVLEGTLQLWKFGPGLAMAGPVVVGEPDVSFPLYAPRLDTRQPEQLSANHPLTLNKGSEWILNGDQTLRDLRMHGATIVTTNQFIQSTLHLAAARVESSGYDRIHGRLEIEPGLTQVRIGEDSFEGLILNGELAGGPDAQLVLESTGAENDALAHLALRGTTPNTYSGAVSVGGGCQLELGKAAPFPVPALHGPITVGTTNSEARAVLYVSGFSHGGQLVGNALTLHPGATMQASGTNRLGLLTVNGGRIESFSSAQSLQLEGPLTVGPRGATLLGNYEFPNTLSIVVADGPADNDLVFGNASTHLAGVGFGKSGAGRMLLEAQGNDLSNYASVSTGDLELLSGTYLPYGYAAPGGRLSGLGGFGSLTVGGVLSPGYNGGQGVGLFSVGSINFIDGGRLEMQVGGFGVQEHDLIFFGLADTAAGQLEVSVSADVTDARPIALLDPRGGAPAAPFANAPEGIVFTQHGRQYQLNYNTLGRTTLRYLPLVNTEPVAIPDLGASTPYPSILTVSNLPGVVGGVSVTLHGFSHTWPIDVQVLLVSPAGQAVMLMGRCGNNVAVNNLTLTYRADAPATFAFTNLLVSGSFRPANFLPSDLPAPAPAGPYPTDLTLFRGSHPNGDWKLYVADAGPGDHGSFTSWSLQIENPPVLSLRSTATNEVAVSWNTNYVGYRLQSREQFGAGTWLDEMQPFQVAPVANGAFTVPFTNDTPARFFRLLK